MDSTAWFLLGEFTVLLGLAAVLFGWLGWHWRGADKTGRFTKLEAQLKEETKAKRYAMDERDAARAEVHAESASVHVSDAARLIEESEALENQNIRLRDDLSAARREATLQADAAAKAQETRTALELETTRLQSEITHLHAQSATTLSDAKQQLKAAESQIQQLKTTQHDPAVDTALKTAQNDIAQLQQQLAADTQAASQQFQTLQSKNQHLQLEVQSLRADLQAAKTSVASQPTLPSVTQTDPATTPLIPAAPAAVPVVPKPKTIRITAPKPKASHPATITAEEKLAQLQHALAPQLTLLAALTQERDDWTRRIATLQAKTPPDPAGLGLARRSLASSEERLTTATTATQSLQDQQHALQRALEQSTTLVSVPDDDLTKIKGIKSVIRDQLHAFGIRTYRQIASWTAEDLHAYSELLAFKNRAARDHWQDQARQLEASK